MPIPAFHQFKIRLPTDLFKRLESEAESSGRSVSAEMIQRIESTFAQPTATSRLNETLARITEITAANQRKLEATQTDVATTSAVLLAVIDQIRKGKDPSEKMKQARDIAAGLAKQYETPPGKPKK